MQKLFHQITVAGWKKVQVINREEIAEAELRYCFDLIDKNKSGHITLDVQSTINNLFFTLLILGFHESVKAIRK